VVEHGYAAGILIPATLVLAMQLIGGISSILLRS